MSTLNELRDFVRTVDPALQRLFPGAFDEVLSTDPHVLHLWDHDTARPLSSTRSKDYPLELRTDPSGLRFFSKVAPTSYSADLRTLLEGGVIDQSSFAFTVAADEWKIRDLDGQEVVERTILQVDELFDVTTCALGAYPTTDSALAVRSLSLGRRTDGADDEEGAAPDKVGDETENAPADDQPVVEPRASDEDAAREIARLKRDANASVLVARERLLRGKEADE
jgi:HK97 family phage prohead protease